MTKRLYSFTPLFLILALLPLSVGAQTTSNDVVLRFREQNNQFQQQYLDNQSELGRLNRTIDSYAQQIADGTFAIFIRSFCGAFADDEQNNDAARKRGSIVKTGLMFNKGLSEESFIQTTYPLDIDSIPGAVIVGVYPAMTLVEQLPFAPATVSQTRIERAEYASTTTPTNTTKAQSTPIKSEKSEAIPITIVFKPEETPKKQEVVYTIQSEEERRASLRPDVSKASSTTVFYWRTNLAHWLMLAPDWGFEFRIKNRVGFMINCSLTHWDWNGTDNHYRFWKGNPELRVYFGHNRRIYAGVEYHAGQFNFKPQNIGNQGFFQGGGLTGGYMFKLGNKLSLDLNLGLGYTNVDYQTYRHVEKVSVFRSNEMKDIIGINQVGISLVWNVL